MKLKMIAPLIAAALSVGSLAMASESGAPAPCSCPSAKVKKQQKQTMYRTGRAAAVKGDAT